MGHTEIGIAAFAGVMILLFLLRRVVGLFWTASAFYAATVSYLRLGFDPPVPSALVTLYSVTSLIALMLYVTSSEEGRKAFFGPIVAVMTRRGLWPLRWLLLLAIPALVAWKSYQAGLPAVDAPPRIRSVHPSPPNTVQFKPRRFAESKEVAVDLMKGDNPLRHLASKDPDAFKAKVAQGKRVYYQNCYYCHGDTLAADGHYADAVKPTPADFTDPGTIAMLQETFLFWRISKGGPGLPDAGTPWDSTMPVWEKFLDEDEIWSVILFMYEYTGYQPRGKGAH